jgi:hypothetical protein
MLIEHFILAEIYKKKQLWKKNLKKQWQVIYKNWAFVKNVYEHLTRIRKGINSQV